MRETKRMIALRYWLLGKNFNMALAAMELGTSVHTGVRKDGFTPEFDHQISIAHYVRTLPNLRYPEETIATVFLHDAREDGGVQDHTIRDLCGSLVADSVWNMTKEWQGVKRNEDELFAMMAEDPIASIGKGSDRGHNFKTMPGVFSLPKQANYLLEAEQRIVPMIKKARRNFPDQEPAYENIKYLLRTQIDTIRAYLPEELTAELKVIAS